MAAFLAGPVKEQLGFKVHWTLPDYLQRSARHIASKTDVEQAMAVGKAAVQYALKGMNATMPVIKRTSDSPYRWKIEPAPLDTVAHHEKKMPAASSARTVTASPPPHGNTGAADPRRGAAALREGRDS